MKNLFFIAFLAIAFAGTAQNRQNKKTENHKEHRQKMMAMSPDQIATLRTKQMELRLDLNESQQTEYKKFQLKAVKQRKSLTTSDKKAADLTSEEIFKMKNARLDQKLQAKSEMKRILNDEQYEKWQKMASKKNMKRSAMGRTAKMHDNRNHKG